MFHSSIYWSLNEQRFQKVLLKIHEDHGYFISCCSGQSLETNISPIHIQHSPVLASVTQWLFRASKQTLWTCFMDAFGHFTSSAGFQQISVICWLDPCLLYCGIYQNGFTMFTHRWKLSNISKTKYATMVQAAVLKLHVPIIFFFFNPIDCSYNLCNSVWDSLSLFSCPPLPFLGSLFKSAIKISIKSLINPLNATKFHFSPPQHHKNTVVFILICTQKIHL